MTVFVFVGAACAACAAYAAVAATIGIADATITITTLTVAVADWFVDIAVTVNDICGSVENSLYCYCYCRCQGQANQLLIKKELLLLLSMATVVGCSLFPS